MAVHVRAGGSVGLVVTLVIFVLLWIGSTVAAIVAMANNKDLELRAQQATDDLSRFVSKGTNSLNEDQLPIVADALNNTNATVVRQLVDENSRLKGVIMGQGDVRYNAVLTAVRQANPAWGQDTILTTEIAKLTQELQMAREQNDRLTAEMNDERAKRLAAEESRTEQNQAYNTSVAGLNTKLASQDQNLVAYRGQVDQRFSSLDDQLAALQAQKAREINDLLGQNAQLEQTKRLLERRLEERGRTQSRPDGPESWKLPDGQVSSALIEENVVFINRGRNDHVLLGLTFEVYSRKTGVVSDDTGELRGKGTVEVISVSENSSVCRVVRVTRGQAIVEGDLIANTVYDPNITFKFHVHGDFDIDNVGQPSEVDRRRIETMIEEWGGKLTPQLTYDVDFLVLGREPALPERPEDQLDPVAMQRFAADQKRFESYQELIGEAKALKIPVLNQNRFLVLIGYYQR